MSYSPTPLEEVRGDQTAIGVSENGHKYVVQSVVQNGKKYVVEYIVQYVQNRVKLR